MSRIIAHRGNLLGPNKKYENTIFAIKKCIEEGFDVEIDVRYDSASDKLYLGHDSYAEVIDIVFLELHIDRLWIHCKTLETLNYFAGSKYSYFWHEDDYFTLTSCHDIWAHPKSYSHTSILHYPTKYTNAILVLPENAVGGSIFEIPNNVYGVCTDYPYEIKFTSWMD